MLKLNESYKLSQGYRGGVHRSGLVADPTQVGVCENKNMKTVSLDRALQKTKTF